MKFYHKFNELSFYLKKNVFRLTKSLPYLFVFFLPSQFGKYFFMPFSFVDGVRVDYLSIAIFFTDILSLILVVANRGLLIDLFSSLFKSKSKILKLLIFFFFFFNIAFSSSYEIALFRLFKTTQFMIIFILFYHLNLNLNKVTVAILIASLLQLTISVYQFSSGQSLGNFFYFLGERSFDLGSVGIAKTSINGVEFLRSYGTFSHPNSMAGFFLLIYGFYLFYSDRLNIKKSYKHIVLLVCGILIFLSFSKAATLVFFIVSVVTVLKQNYRDCLICNISKIFVPFILLIIVATGVGDPDSFGKRLFLINSALNIIGDNFIFGVGGGNYLYHQANFANPYPYIFLQPVHNIFLLFFAEYGVMGVSLILFTVLKIKNNIFAHDSKVFWIFLIVVATGLNDHYWLTLQQNFVLLPVIFGVMGNKHQKA